MLKIVWITDLHMRSPGDPAAAAMRERLDRVLAHAFARHADAALCVITGDIAHTGEAGQYEAFGDAIRACPVPWRVLPGNHDDRARLAATANLPLCGPAQTLRGATDLGGYRLLFIDTQLTGEDAGMVRPADLEWLREELAGTPDPALLFMHHQPGRVFIPSSDTIGLVDGAAFEDVLARHRDRIAHIFFGHCHLPVSGSVGGIACTGLPATAVQQTANFADLAFIADDGAPPCYGVILADGANLACHTIPVRL